MPGGFVPAVEAGIREAMEHGTLAGYPVHDVRVSLVDGQHHTVDSSEIAFKICASMGFKEAMAKASPVLLEPIVKLTISAPSESVGDVIGDLNSRRGHPLGMEPKGVGTEIVAEVPMADVLDYAPALRAITGGRGEYTLEFGSSTFRQVSALSQNPCNKTTGVPWPSTSIARVRAPSRVSRYSRIRVLTSRIEPDLPPPRRRSRRTPGRG